MRHVTLGGTRIRDTTGSVFNRFLSRRVAGKKPTLVFFANANFVVKCRHLAAEIASDKQCFVLNDGIAVQAAARLRYGHKFRENLNGTDFVPAFLASVRTHTSVYLLGGSVASVEGAAAALKRLPGISIVGSQDGYSLWRDELAVERIRTAKPDVLIVGLGNPLQEEWIVKNRSDLDVPLIFGAGALFDFLSGAKPRAPALLRALHLEWAFRLALEPRRLLKRYTLDTVRFFALAFSSQVHPAKNVGSLRRKSKVAR
jgi:beta-1,4-glucosyltransferase